MPTCCDWIEAFKGVFYLYTGLLPYVNIPYDTCPASFLTRDLLGRLLQRAHDSDTHKKSIGFGLFAFVQFLFKFPAPVIFTNLNKRGVVTALWTINDDDEIAWVYRNTNTGGIVTDRPIHAKSMLEKLESVGGRRRAKEGLI